MLFNAPKTRLGLRGHYAIADHCKMIAAARGWGLVCRGADRYSLEPAPKYQALCPNHIAHENGVFTAKNIQTFLEFTHQPIRRALERVAPVSKSREDQGAHAARLQERRVMIHRLLRLMTTGRVIIPPDYYKSLEGESAECHAATERKARDRETWANAPEFGATKTRVSSIPATLVDSERGFIFDLSRSMLHDSFAHAALREKFWFLVQAATGKKFAERTEQLVLSGQVLENLCLHASREWREIVPLLEQAEKSEIIQHHMQNIRVQQQTQNSDMGINLKAVLQTTTALTPLLNSPQTKAIWSYYYRSQRNAPVMRQILREHEAFSAIAKAHLDGAERDLSPQGILQEFSPLMSFYAELAAIMDRPDFHDLLNIQNPAIEKDAGPHHEKVLEAFRRAAKKAGSMPRQWGRTIRDWASEFGGEIKTAVREHPYLTATFVAAMLGIGGYINHRKIDQRNVENNTTLVFREEGIQQRMSDIGRYPEEAQRMQDFHFDYFIGGLVKFKHYAYDGFIIGPVQFVYGLAENVVPEDHQSHFISAANNTIKPVSNIIFYGDAFQNFTHVFYLAGCLYLGFRLGTRRTVSVLGEFLEEPMDMACYTASAFKNTITRKGDPFTDKIAKMKDRLNARMPMDLKLQDGQQETLILTPLKVSAATAATFAGTCVVLDLLGKGGAFTNAVAAGAGYSSAAALTVSAFLIYNFFQDILGIHLVGGASNVLTADIAGKTWRGGIKPLVLAGMETLGEDRLKDLISPAPTEAISLGPTVPHHY
ncbi:MAG: hypothetical protein L6Q57_01755 [Alphaproteobacteria bacterium]|nr:hypothetical protein [Alphaproteobacteria bacterium]